MVARPRHPPGFRCLGRGRKSQSSVW
jgi:hypothetical protein